MIYEDFSNSVCFDCQTEKSTHANVTYGTLHCAACTKEHIELFYATNSFMLKIDEPWDRNATEVVFYGGNKAFRDFLEPYKMKGKELTIKILYKSDCGSYWRKNLRAKCYGKKYGWGEPPKNLSEGIDFITTSIYKGFNKVQKDVSKEVKSK